MPGPYMGVGAPLFAVFVGRGLDPSAGRRGRRPLQLGESYVPLDVGRHAPMPPRGGARFPGKVSSCGEMRRGEGTPPYGAGIRFVTVVGGGVLDAPHGCYGTPWAAIYGFRAS